MLNCCRSGQLENSLYLRLHEGFEGVERVGAGGMQSLLFSQHSSACHQFTSSALTSSDLPDRPRAPQSAGQLNQSQTCSFNLLLLLQTRERRITNDLANIAVVSPREESFVLLLLRSFSWGMSFRRNLRKSSDFFLLTKATFNWFQEFFECLFCPASL